MNLMPPTLNQKPGPKTGKADAAIASFNESRARLEAAKAERAELEVGELKGELLRRDDVRGAMAIAVGAFTQTLRSISDTLESELGLDPKVAERIAVIHDEALAELSKQMKALSKDA